MSSTGFRGEREFRVDAQTYGDDGMIKSYYRCFSGLNAGTARAIVDHLSGKR